MIKHAKETNNCITAWKLSRNRTYDPGGGNTVIQNSKLSLKAFHGSKWRNFNVRYEKVPEFVPQKR